MKNSKLILTLLAFALIGPNCLAAGESVEVSAFTFQVQCQNNQPTHVVPSLYSVDQKHISYKIIDRDPRSTLFYVQSGQLVFRPSANTPPVYVGPVVVDTCGYGQLANAYTTSLNANVGRVWISDYKHSLEYVWCIGGHKQIFSESGTLWIGAYSYPFSLRIDMGGCNPR